MEKTANIVMSAGTFVILLVSPGCNKNQSPETPAAPLGPASSRVGTACQFRATATDPDGDLVSLRFDWDNADTSDWSPPFASGETLRVEHVFAYPDSYYVSVQARDEHGEQSAWSNWHIIAIADTVNLPPSAPGVTSDVDTGIVGERYDFMVAGTDPNGDRIAYQVAWGDTDTSQWGALVGTGTTVTMGHAWLDTGTFVVTARSRDEKGAIGDWSVGYEILILLARD